MENHVFVINLIRNSNNQYYAIIKRDEMGSLVVLQY